MKCPKGHKFKIPKSIVPFEQVFIGIFAAACPVCGTGITIKKTFFGGWRIATENDMMKAFKKGNK